MIEKHLLLIKLQKDFELAHLCSFTPETLRTFSNLVKNFKIMKK